MTVPATITTTPLRSTTSAQDSGRDPYAPTAEDRQRAQAMHRAWNAYRGRFRGDDEQWPLLWTKGEEPNPNILINRCGPAVDTDVAWLFGESVSISAKKLPKAAQAYLDQAWGVSTDDSSDDDKMALLQELATNGAICGTAYVKIVWDEDDDTQEYPELVVLDSTMVRVRTAPHNAKVVICYIIEYTIPDPNSRSGEMGTFRQVIELTDKDGGQKLTGTPDPDDYWTITDWYKAPNASNFIVMAPDAESGQQQNPRVWGYPWAPIDACPHVVVPNRFYGRPRITPDVIHINEAICTVASNINKIGLRHGHPILFTVKTGSNQRSIRHKPGTILEVSSPVQAVEAHGDVANLMAFEEDLRADFDEETHVPGQAFGRQKDIPRTPVSGVAIRLSYGPLVADITKERRTYGALIRRVSRHMLELKNASWADAAISLGWQDPLPADDLQQAQVVQAADAVGVMSKRTAAEKFGLDWDVEQANMQEETQDALAAMAKGQAIPTPPPPPPPPLPGQPLDPNQQQQQQQQAPVPGQPGPASTPTPPINHPAAIAARQAAQVAAGKTPTPGGL